MECLAALLYQLAAYPYGGANGDSEITVILVWGPLAQEGEYVQFYSS
jgi:hypothetical protein